MTKEELIEMLDDRLDGWELAELLGLTAREICLEFEDKIDEKIKDIKELLDLEDEDETDTD